MRKVLIGILVMVLAVSLVACSAEKAIIGTWVEHETVLGVVTETTYIFNEDGSGSMTAIDIIDIPFTYAFSEDKLTITTTVLGVEASEEYTYEFDGNKLILTGESDTISLEKAD